ncbi:type I-E CRISPR-associated protein Cas6/Cse3/CasE [Streptomyces sp. NPDC085946]|uniref:type I-E CRISPR-associated protein Cas6/Cse3/CasE n=1 Tax=Streptomyces sp. NPDC085946 TaxID=3365744 RepID=UPI0037CF55A6
MSTPTRFVATQSVLTLDAHHPDVIRAMNDVHDMHRLIMSGHRGWVPEGEDDARSQMGLLSAWTVNLRTQTLTLITQARVTPDWTPVPRAALLQAPHLIKVDQPIKAGDTYTFRAFINPIRAVMPTAGPKKGQRGRRTASMSPHHAAEWFMQRLQPEGEPSIGPSGIKRIGADADPARITTTMLPPLISTAKKGLKVVRAEVRGQLTVTDPVTFVHTLTEGLGKARSYGVGLVLVRK